ncbi:hypothetical protein M408DRAFT_145778 [Serendipita vermifera MAFF 305830]|uniref:Uncharacterized protein n=1 Tax=Serendipita vermifera MAFF 305830 TaxID=933852 RepID=A0A0C3A6H7_SERVB|nr:hypothetical protein M408DRAFT_145778 [Serendipita vermifera MAFF 305830]
MREVNLLPLDLQAFEEARYDQFLRQILFFLISSILSVQTIESRKSQYRKSASTYSKVEFAIQKEPNQTSKSARQRY